MKRLHKRLLMLALFAVSIFGYAFYPEDRLPDKISVEKLVVYKSKRILELWDNGQMIKEYEISLGGNPIGHKEKEGDSRTPEGVYFIDAKNPHSQYHLNLGISYPDEKDRRNSENPGGDIKIHGLRNGIGWIGKFQRFIDWIDGCIDVTDEEIEEIYRVVPIGTRIEIKP